MDSTSPFVIHNRCSFDAFVFLWIVCARNMFNFRQSSRRSQGSHPWLTFPRISSDSTMRRWRKKPDKLKKKEIYVPDALDWEWLGGARYEEELAPYLVITFNHNGVSLTCDGWNRLFRIQEPVYQELCWEYFSTVSFRGGNDYYNPGNIKFCLGGEYCQCSMVELSWRLGIYDQQLVNTVEFGTFLEQCHQVFPDGVRVIFGGILSPTRCTLQNLLKKGAFDPRLTDSFTVLSQVPSTKGKMIIKSLPLMYSIYGVLILLTLFSASHIA